VSVVQVPRGTHYAGDVVAGIAIGLIAQRVSDAAIDLAVRWARREFAEGRRTVARPSGVRLS
jgi:hypothetical protein